jgi:hypothetical protein
MMGGDHSHDQSDSVASDGSAHHLPGVGPANHIKQPWNILSAFQAGSETYRQRIYVNIISTAEHRLMPCFLFLLLFWDGGGVTEDHLMSYLSVQ